MTDDQTPVQTAEDTGLSEAVETLTNVDTPDTEVDIEDIVLSADDLTDNEETKETEETPDEEAATDSEEVEAEETTDSAESQKPEETKESVEEEQPTESSDDKAEKAREAFKEREARRKAEQTLKEEREAREKQDLERYLADAEDDADDFARREQAVGRYLLQKERAALNEERLQIGLDKAVADIDLFKTGSPEVKEALAVAVDDFERMFVRKDDNGNLLEVNGDIYKFLNDKAESIRKLTEVGKRQQAKSKENARARTETVPTKPPKEAKKDPYLDAFQEEANHW